MTELSLDFRHVETKTHFHVVATLFILPQFIDIIVVLLHNIIDFLYCSLKYI